MTEAASLLLPFAAQSTQTHVLVGNGLLGRLSVPEPQVALLHDADLPAEWVAAAQEALQPLVTLPVTSGESGKTLDEVARLLSALAEAGLTRSGAVAALGGGATTDVAGFAAAAYLRGVPFYAMPTTLLGMVDAAIGGKTGVNLPWGKNLAGAFWPARAVWCDVDTLATLPERDFRSGAAEVFKHGLLTPLGKVAEGQSLIARVLGQDEDGLPSLSAASPDLADTVLEAVRVKVDTVARDPTEVGERAFLNLGHTLGHALETATAHTLPHGEAVGYGLHFAACLSESLGDTDAQVLTPYTRAFLQWQRPAALPPFTLAELWPLLNRDKKIDAEGLRWVLLRAIGEPYLARAAGPSVASAFARWQEELSELCLLQD